MKKTKELVTAAPAMVPAAPKPKSGDVRRQSSSKDKRIAAKNGGTVNRLPVEQSLRRVEEPRSDAPPSSSVTEKVDDDDSTGKKKSKGAQVKRAANAILRHLAKQKTHRKPMITHDTTNGVKRQQPRQPPPVSSATSATSQKSTNTKKTCKPQKKSSFSSTTSVLIHPPTTTSTTSKGSATPSTTLNSSVTSTSSNSRNGNNNNHPATTKKPSTKSKQPTTKKNSYDKGSTTSTIPTQHLSEHYEEKITIDNVLNKRTAIPNPASSRIFSPVVPSRHSTGGAGGNNGTYDDDDDDDGSFGALSSFRGGQLRWWDMKRVRAMGYWIREIVSSDAGILGLSFAVSVVVMCQHLDDLADMAWVLVSWSCFSFTLGHWVGIVIGGGSSDRRSTIRDIVSSRGGTKDISRQLLENRNMVSMVKSIMCVPDNASNTSSAVSSSSLPNILRHHHFWSNLTSHMKKNEKETWALNAHKPVARYLQKRLLKLRHVRRKSVIVTKTFPEGHGEGNDAAKTSMEHKDEGVLTDASGDEYRYQRMGAMNASHVPVSLVEEVVQPCCRLRGMDVFLSDDPLTELYRRDLLIQCGLRDIPTFVINVMAPCVNICFYYELPHWFHSFADDHQPSYDSHSEFDDDNDSHSAQQLPHDMTILQHVLSLDTRSLIHSLKIMPCVPVAPLPIRMLAPPQKEYTIEGPNLPVTLYREEGRTDETTGKSLAPVIELDIDLMSSPSVRRLTTLGLRYLHECVIDLAFILAFEGEECCLGMIRMDRVDLKTGAVVPVPGEKEDVMMVSKMNHGGEAVKQ